MVVQATEIQWELPCRDVGLSLNELIQLANTLDNLLHYKHTTSTLPCHSLHPGRNIAVSGSVPVPEKIKNKKALKR